MKKSKLLHEERKAVYRNQKTETIEIPYVRSIKVFWKGLFSGMKLAFRPSDGFLNPLGCGQILAEP